MTITTLEKAEKIIFEANAEKATRRRETAELTAQAAGDLEAAKARLQGIQDTLRGGERVPADDWIMAHAEVDILTELQKGHEARGRKLVDQLATKQTAQVVANTISDFLDGTVPVVATFAEVDPASIKAPAVVVLQREDDRYDNRGHVAVAGKVGRAHTIQVQHYRIPKLHAGIDGEELSKFADQRLVKLELHRTGAKDMPAGAVLETYRVELVADPLEPPKLEKTPTGESIESAVSTYVHRFIDRLERGLPNSRYRYVVTDKHAGLDGVTIDGDQYTATAKMSTEIGLQKLTEHDGRWTAVTLESVDNPAEKTAELDPDEITGTLVHKGGIVTATKDARITRTSTDIQGYKHRRLKLDVVVDIAARVPETAVEDGIDTEGLTPAEIAEMRKIGAL
ncbi:hypothetical protein [Flexivirga oryzae]|uniref:Uncharacterized protein n=1 Tax=Flexivirga oryzae TaxID=1794944 RepID=A0A839N8P3_9MICO|nr:hypothetical protein [Flexivirga oryzae]MBB2891121.1 hypothetical protein [Flexivirga oryzae]